jgi:hypothetical protein
MSVPAQVDVGEAFGYVFRSRNWFGRLLLGGVCLLFFWVFLIPVFILLGYFVEAARTISRGGRELPPWTDIGTKLREGFILAVILFIWNLPGEILSGGTYSCAGGVCGFHSTAASNIGTLYALLLGLLTPAIWSQYIEGGGFSAAFDFRAVFRRAGQYPGMTVMVWLMVIVAAIIGVAGFILLLVGALITLPYAFAVASNLYGQFSSRTRGAPTPA